MRITRIPTCHPDRKHQGVGLCNTCYGEVYRTGTRPRVKPKLSPSCHPEKRYGAHGLCHDCYGAKRYKENSTLLRTKRLAKLTGRPLNELLPTVEKLVKEQTSCEICDSTTKLVIDHDHKTGHIRGILCASHNTLLGMAGEDHEVLKNAVRYLMRKDREYYEACKEHSCA